MLPMIDIPVEEKKLISAMNSLSKCQQEGTVVDIDFVDFGRGRPNVGRIQINCLTPNQMVIIYQVDESKEV